jgi:hypothetical protein
LKGKNEMKFIGNYRSYPVYSIAPGARASFDDMEENVIYIIADGDMYLNGNMVGKMQRSTGRVLIWWDDEVSDYWPEKHKSAKVEAAFKVPEPDVGKEVKIDELVTFDLDGFLAEIDKRLEECLIL